MLTELRTKAQCTTSSCDKIQAIMTDSYELWLMNSGEKQVEVGPLELFGFNTGAIEHRPLGILSLVLLTRLTLHPRQCAHSEGLRHHVAFDQ